MRRRIAALLLSAGIAAAAGVASGCGRGAVRSAPPREERAPTWSDVFDGTPDLYAVIRPKALRRDGVYGAFFSALVRVAAARGIARGDTMVQAAEGAEEIIVGLDEGLDAALILRGVPASLDPERITDASGRPLFRPKRERSRVIEYELLDQQSAGDGALFVLPDRTWVGALGAARARARRAFAAPMSRPAPKLDARALAVVRVSGPLVRAFDRHPTFGVLAKKVVSATFSLEPARGGVRVVLLYKDDAASARAEGHARRLADELATKLAWLKDRAIVREGSAVIVRIAVPPRLLEELPRASGDDLDL